MLFEPVAKDIARYLESESARLSDGMLKDLLATARQWKPAGYDEEMEKRRLAYLGLDTPLLEQALEARYKTTWKEMGRMSLNLTRLIAEVDASVYDFDALRYLVDEDNAKIKDASDSAKAWEKAKDKAALDSSMVEIERRLMVVDTQPVRAWWEPLRGRFEVRPFWPSTVNVIAHPHRPHDSRYWLCLIAEIAGPNGFAKPAQDEEGPSKWFEVWWRSWRGFDRMGVPQFGIWHRTIMADDGSSYDAFGAAQTAWVDAQGQPLPLPWFFLQNGMPEGSPFNWANHDVFKSVHDVNVTWCNVFFTLDMQAHAELVLESDSVDKKTIEGGPNKVMQIRRGDRLYAIQMNPQLGAMVDVVKDYMRALAITRRQSEDAYSWEKGDPMTGVSRRIKNEPQEKARREHAKQRKREEEEYLGPLFLSFSDAFGGTSFLDEGLSMRMTPREPPSYEEPVQAQQRSIEAKKAGFISEARAAVESGWYPDLETAIGAGLSDERKEEKPAPPPAFGQPPAAPGDDEEPEEPEDTDEAE